MKILLAAAGALSLLASASVASTVGFHFGSGSQTYGSTDYYSSSIYQEEGDKTLTVTGIRCDDNKGPNHDSCGAEGGLYEWSNGIGMKKVGTSDYHTVDGKYSNEFLKLTFNKDVVLDWVKFSYFGDDDKFRLYTWNGSEWEKEGKFGDGSSTYYFGEDYTSSMFLVGARGDHDSWKFKGAGVSHPDVIPLPAAGWLLLGGLGGLAAMKRRKKA